MSVQVEIVWIFKIYSELSGIDYPGVMEKYLEWVWAFGVNLTGQMEKPR